jgi:hypothetical protein
LPTRSTVAVGESLVVDVDARALRSGSVHRVAIVAAGSADASAAELARISMPVSPDRVRIALPARIAGASEVRLYYIPTAGSSSVVAARAPVTVE